MIKLNPKSIGKTGSLLGNFLRLLSVLFPWVTLSCVLYDNDVIINKEEYIISVLYNNNLAISDSFSISFDGYFALLIIILISSAVLLFNDIIALRRYSPSKNRLEFFGILQLFSQIASVLFLMNVFSVLSENRLIHPFMTLSYQIEGTAVNLIINSTFSVGIYLWIAGILVQGPESLDNSQLVIMLLGGITEKHVHKMSQKIDSIVRNHLSEINLGQARLTGDGKTVNDAFLFKPVSENNITAKMGLTQTQSQTEETQGKGSNEFEKLFLKKTYS